MRQITEQETRDRIELTLNMIRSVDSKCHTFKLEEKKQLSSSLQKMKIIADNIVSSVRLLMSKILTNTVSSAAKGNH